MTLVDNDKHLSSVLRKVENCRVPGVAGPTAHMQGGGAFTASVPSSLSAYRKVVPMEHHTYLGKRLLDNPADAGIVTTWMLRDVARRAAARRDRPVFYREGS